ncbi:dihydroorotase [Sinimarinibacterium sp. NLF-5-8]|uniref:dihydroorotase n=1 Tax=Sinimarinibacterium sp. NLF-5-8 TaxID=2698684 RepID=UPI00137BEA78|nr:dihydroorotase [Sinimarinibacterium sp. NLF-5-8]QHS09499.1 dihydroorotase [Sinimarinibacterium sp. NLF-5-8]
MNPSTPDWSARAQQSQPTPSHDHAQCTLIRGARVLDPASGLDQVADVRIDQGMIQAIGPDLAAGEAQIINADGHWLIPGIVDLCARLREPGQSHKATMASEIPAALSGGITHLLLPPDTSPVIDTPAMVMRVQRIASSAGALDLRIVGALTKNLDGESLAELSALKQAGVVGISNAWAPMANTRMVRRALDYARGLGLTVHVQAQDPALAAGGCAHEGAVATRLGLTPIPVAAEVAALRFWLSMIEDTGARVHFGRLSTARGVEIIEWAQRHDLPVSADVAAHQLHLIDEDIDGFDAQCHVLPPLRGREDRAALREALRRGVITAVCSDHQPHEPDAKINPFALTAPGISALETLLPLTLALVDEGVLDPLTAVARLTCDPARIAGLDAGHLRIGSPANLVLVKTGHPWTLRRAQMASAGRNTPFAERSFASRAIGTWCAGQRVA